MISWEFDQKTAESKYFVRFSQVSALEYVLFRQILLYCCRTHNAKRYEICVGTVSKYIKLNSNDYIPERSFYLANMFLKTH